MLAPAQQSNASIAIVDPGPDAEGFRFDVCLRGARGAVCAADVAGQAVMRIGRYELVNNLALAPMAGVTDLPFRLLCRRMGAGIAAGEMLTCDVRLWHTEKSRRRMDHSGEPEPRVVQIAGGDPEMMAEAAQRNVDAGAQIIDINMGCPAKKVCNKAAGSALMRDEPLVQAILGSGCQGGECAGDIKNAHAAGIPSIAATRRAGRHQLRRCRWQGQRRRFAWLYRQRGTGGKRSSATRKIASGIWISRIERTSSKEMPVGHAKKPESIRFSTLAAGYASSNARENQRDLHRHDQGAQIDEEFRQHAHKRDRRQQQAEGARRHPPPEAIPPASKRHFARLKARKRKSVRHSSSRIKR